MVICVIKPFYPCFPFLFSLKTSGSIEMECWTKMGKICCSKLWHNKNCFPNWKQNSLNILSWKRDSNIDDFLWMFITCTMCASVPYMTHFCWCFQNKNAPLSKYTSKKMCISLNVPAKKELPLLKSKKKPAKFLKIKESFTFKIHEIFLSDLVIKEVWYNYSAHCSANLFIIEISSNSHI